jgi:hypothetical protein
MAPASSPRRPSPLTRESTRSACSSVAEGDVAASSARTDYVTATPGVRRLGEAGQQNGEDLGWTVQEAAREYSAGSVYAEEWIRQPIRPGPYSATSEMFSGCTPRPVTRAPGNIHAELVALQDRIDGFDCTVDLIDP